MSKRAALSPAEISPLEIARIVTMALNEDLASGDVTSRAVIPPDAMAHGVFAAREPLTVSGFPIVAAVFAALDVGVDIDVTHAEGARAEKGAALARIDGRAHAILAGERVALNLFQRMCGVATRTRTFVDALPAGSATRIADTRKTTPGLRALDRYAVRCGGGFSHRDHLGSGVMIKDNHIIVCGGVRPAIERARSSAPHTLRIEVEVDGLAQLDEALDAGADVIMFDNFDDATVRLAMERVAARARRPVIEVSGGIDLARVATLGAMGVDVISIGSLTHSARAMDIGLDLSVRGSWKT